MKTKTLTLMSLSIFVLVFSLAFASATLTFQPSSIVEDPITSGNTQSVAFKFNLTDSSDGNDATLAWDAEVTNGPSQLSITKPSLNTLADGLTEELTAKINNIPYDFEGLIQVDLKVNDTSDSSSRTLPLQVSVNTHDNNFCSANWDSDSSDLVLEIDMESDGDEEEDWKPLDTITLDLEFENEREEVEGNEGDNDLDDVVFELGLFDESGSNVADDLIWLSEDEEKFEFGDVDEDGGDAEHAFKFRVHPDMDEGDYKLMIKAYPDGEENTDCIAFSKDLTSFGTSAYYAKIDFSLESDDDKAMIVDTRGLDFKAGCGDSISIIADVWNIGEEDFDEDGDSVKVRLTNEDLNLELYEVIDDSIKAGDKSEVAFSFTIPEGTEEKQYNLEFTTYYDYDEDKGEYKEQSEDTFNVRMTLEGNCALPSADIPTGATTIEAGGKAGEELIVKTTISNSGTTTNTYALGLSGYTEWASEADLSKSSITLSPGETAELNVTLQVKDDAEGEQSFELQATSEGYTVLTQPISVPIEAKESLLKGIGGDDSALTLLIILIGVLVLAIVITIIVKVASKKK